MMNIKIFPTKKCRVVSRRSVRQVTVLLVVLALSFAFLLSAAQEKNPLAIILQKGTAGMKLKGDKRIIVRNDALYVQSGKQLSPLFPSSPRFTIKRNASRLQAKEIEALALRAVKAKLGDQYNQSYKVHSSFKLKNSTGNVKTVLCNMTFEYKNIWYAEEKEIEMVLENDKGVHKLKEVRILRAPLRMVKPMRKISTRKPLKKTKATPMKRKMVLASSPKVDYGAEKRKIVNLDVSRIAEISDNYKTFELVPVYQLAAKYRVPIQILGPSAKGLANTAYPEVITAKAATDQVHVIMSLALGSADKLIGPTQSSKSKVLNYLRNGQNLVAWNNVGHGGPSTIYQNGTQINASDLPTGTLFKGLKGCVCLVNSCQTFHDPLKAAIIDKQPRVYIAGVLNLPMVTSEGSNPNFWYKTLIQKKPMSVAYSETNTASGLTGYWGYWGYGGKF